MRTTKVEDDLLNCETVSNVKDKYTFKINKKDGVEITKFTVGGADYMNTDAKRKYYRAKLP